MPAISAACTSTATTRAIPTPSRRWWSPKPRSSARPSISWSSDVFGPEAYAAPTKLYNYLAPTYWNHWGIKEPTRPAFPIHQTVLAAQDRVLAQVLSPVTLARLLDSEMKVPAKQDVFTAAELLHR